MTWSWDYALSILPEILGGLLVSLQATVLGAVMAFLLGLVLALARRSDRALIYRPVGFFVEFVRGTPLLVQLYFIFYIFPSFGLTLPAFAAGVIALGVYNSAYISEVYRAGIDGIPRGQWEAAKALNLPVRRTWTGIVLPQAIPAVIPALGNYVILIFKESALLSAITVQEMLGSALEVGSLSLRYLEPIAIVGLIFVVVSYASSLLVRRLERRFAART
jgi:polar amino acid transport system permease protein